MEIITCDENNMADDLSQAYEEGYRLRQVYEEGYQQGRIDEAEYWKYEAIKLRSEYEELKRELQLQRYFK